MAAPLASRFQNLHEFVTQARINLDRHIEQLHRLRDLGFPPLV
jgi:hypothetical protein